MKFGERLKKTREMRGLTQLELHWTSNVSTAAIANIETGKTNPTLETALALAEGLKMPLSYFVQDYGTYQKEIGLQEVQKHVAIAKTYRERCEKLKARVLETEKENRELKRWKDTMEMIGRIIDDARDGKT